LARPFQNYFFYPTQSIIRFWIFLNLVYNQFVCLKNTLDNQLP
jgi:hypothetical protein